MARPARALVDTQALKHNFQQVKSHASAAKVMAVIKANAYGHGLIKIAKALTDADAFAVASIEEALELRDSDITVERPICLLQGFFEAEELMLLSKHHLQPVIHQAHQLDLLDKIVLEEPLDVWLKIDTGMHRLGFDPDSVAATMARLKSLDTVRKIRLMSHFPNADNKFDNTTNEQIDRFLETVSGFNCELSLANSAAILSQPASHLDWVRPGIMLYGAAPLIGYRGEQLNLKPVMSFSSAIIAINQRRQGDTIGYGGDWRCPEDMLIGVVAVGYGDGYPRHAPVGTPVLVNGKRASLIGRVSMDMITVDLRGHTDVRAGDPVVLWGRDLPVEEIAEAAGTISYELLCQVTERIPREFISS